MGGTGLEPVTPSLSISLLCTDFPLDAPTASAFVYAPSSVLVVARGSTVCSCAHPAHARTECDIRARASTKYSHGARSTHTEPQA
jgi:hypothetical protein